VTYTDDPREVEAVLKLASFGAVRDAFFTAHFNVFGYEITNEALAVLLAHSALETGRWSKGLWCWNFGNKKASLSYAGKHCYFRCNELIAGKYEWFDPPHPQTRFRAYDTAAQGAEAQVRFLGTASNPARGNRYQAAWDAAMAGDPAGTVNALHSAGYFTAHLAPYRRAVESLWREYVTKLDAYEGVPGVQGSSTDEHLQDVHAEHEAEGTPLHHSPLLANDIYDAIQRDKIVINKDMS
jgi:hypothetical protein